MSISQAFVLGGDAIFTIETPNNGHRTYRVQFVEANGRYPACYFVKYLAGPDNTSDYQHLGKLDKFSGQVVTTTKSHHLKDSYVLKLLNRVLARVWCDDHAAYEQHGFRTHHEGKCGRCARTLTTPESVAPPSGQAVPPQKPPKPECIMTTYTLCKHCDHFVDENPASMDAQEIAKHIHLENGEQEFDHDAEPGNETHTLEEWHRLRPGLFIKHPDGAIGPNSRHHSQRGKLATETPVA